MIGDNESQQKALVALVAIHRERVGLYEDLLLHIPKEHIKLRSALEDLIAQARMFKQALIETLAEFGEVLDVNNEPDKPGFYEMWCTDVSALQGKPATEQIMDIEQAVQRVYERMLTTQLLDESLEGILQSQQDELDFGMTKLRLVIRKIAGRE